MSLLLFIKTSCLYCCAVLHHLQLLQPRFCKFSCAVILAVRTSAVLCAASSTTSPAMLLQVLLCSFSLAARISALLCCDLLCLPHPPTQLCWVVSWALSTYRSSYKLLLQVLLCSFSLAVRTSALLCCDRCASHTLLHRYVGL